jgi:hypothetical protein
MMIYTLHFQFNLAQLALKFLGGLNLVLGGLSPISPPPVEPPLTETSIVLDELTYPIDHDFGHFAYVQVVYMKNVVHIR